MYLQMVSLFKKLALASIVLGIATALPMNDAYAQGPGGPGGDRNARPNPRFAVAPQVGDQMPDLHIFDDLGNPVSIREITSDGENYSVITLGCLT